MDTAALERALINADAAGDTAAASALAGEITRLRAPAVSPPDKYQQAAIDEQAALKSAGGDEGAGLTRRLAHGATLGADSTILAAAMTPLEMFKRGINPKEAYNYAKAREDQIMGDARKNTGALGTVAEIGGGVGAGLGLARGGLSFGAGLAPDAGMVARTLASAGDAAGMGGFSGAMEGNSLHERGVNALKGAAVGGLLGGALPPAFSLLGAAASPITSNIAARINPQSFAERQVARAISESGLTPAQIGQQVAAANASGSPLMVADAMGNAGQRMLSTVARAPGEGRTAVVNALEARQAGQGRRVSNALAEGFNAPETAAQTEARLTAARAADADAAYGTVRRDANQVDVTGTLNHLDGIIGTQPGQVLTPANDSIEAVLTPFRQRLSRVNPDDFSAVQRIRGDMSDAAEAARRGGLGNRARLIGGAVRQLDTAMENASAGHLAANRNFAQASRDIEAVQTGRDASMRGRSEDTIPAFQGLGPQGQQAFRSGYVDPLIAQTQGAAFGANKARPLINNAFQDEAAAMAPGNALMQRRLANEQTMFETRNTALGGSKTADNLNDHAATGVDPHLIGQIVTGNWHGAVRSLIGAGHSALTGNTPAVRSAIAEILLQRGVNPNQLNQMVGATVQRLQFVQNIARNLGRGASGGLAISNSSTSTKR